MKRLLIASVILVFLFNIAFAATLPTILVSKVDPQPVEPGKDVSIDVTLFNRQSSDTGDFSVSLDINFPVILKSASEDLSRVNLCAGCKKDFKYFLSVDPRASSGTYTIFVKASAQGSEVKQRVDIKVQGRPNLVFYTDTESLSNITPKQQFPVVINVTNIGTGQARQIKIQPDSTQFIVIGGSIKTVDEVNASSARPVEFIFVASSDLEANSYLIPFRLTYLDEQGTTINSSQSLGVRVVNKGDISIQTIKVVSNTGSPTITSGQPFTVIVRLENIGPGDADFVSSDLECPFTSPKKTFLGQLKKDDDAPAVFDLSSPSAGTYECNLTVSYKDDIGRHELKEKFNISVVGGSSPLGIVAAVIIIGLLYFFRKRIMAPFSKKQ